MNYDAVVVGAGPAGSSAAYFLARSGAKVAVVERKSFPRAKTCGDGLTPRAVWMLEEMGLPGLAGFQRSTGLRAIAGKRTLEMKWPALAGRSAFSIVRTRKNLDSEVAAEAQQAGADFHFGLEASPLVNGSGLEGVAFTRKQASAEGGVSVVEQGEIRAPFVLVADGASSPFGRKLGIRRAEGFPMGLAIRTYYECDRDQDDFIESWLSLDNGSQSLPGYGWIFPVGDGSVNVGVGLLSTFGGWRDVNLAKLQRAFIDMLPTSYGITHEGQQEPYQSGRLPMGASVIPPHGAGYLLLGDAAGYVNPFNGEGIAYALETGKIAALHVAEALASGNSTDLTSYSTELRDIYGAYFRVGRKFAKLIGNPAAFKLLTLAGMQSKTLMEVALTVMANLPERRGGRRLRDRLYGLLVKLASLKLPEVSEPSVKFQSRESAETTKA